MATKIADQFDAIARGLAALQAADRLARQVGPSEAGEPQPQPEPPRQMTTAELVAAWKATP